jgi:hypothetical protein
MSQFNIRNIREISTDPTTKFANQLAKKLSKFLTKDQTDKLEGKLDIYSDSKDIDTVVRLHVFTSTKRFTFDTQYFAAEEPDLNTCTIWLQGRSTGTLLRDLSGFDNTATLNGDPIIVDGTPFDYGIHTGGTKSLALRMNRGDHAELFDEQIAIADDARIRILGATTGISWFFRVRVFATDLSDGKRRTIYLKTDDNPVTAGIRVSIDPTNKRWVIQLRRNGGAFISKETGINKFLTDTVYDAFITYTFAGDVVHLYLAKTGDGSPTDETLSTSGYTEEWGPDPTQLGARLFKRGPNSEDGYVYGDLYDFKIFRNRVITSTEAGRHWTNKWTLANIPFGQVMVTNYWATYLDTSLFGYTTAGYTTVGYTAG